MKKNFIALAIVGLSAFSVLLHSCKKDTPDTETQSSVDNSVCEGEFTSRIQIINFLAQNSYKIKSVQTDGPTITTDTINRVLTIDYGQAGMTDTMDGDNRMRKGIIKVTFDSLWHKSKAIATVQLLGYEVSNNGGASYIGYSADNFTIKRIDSLSYTFTIAGGHVSATGYSLQWTTTRTITQVGGHATVTNVYDDAYSASGRSTGVDRNGKSYSVSTTSPIVKQAGCAWIQSGSMDLTPEGLSARTVDYGTGACDNKVGLVINGNSFTFSMN